MPPKKPAKEAKKEAPKKGAPKEPHEAVGTDRGELERLAPPADAGLLSRGWSWGPGGRFLFPVVYISQLTRRDDAPLNRSGPTGFPETGGILFGREGASNDRKRIIINIGIHLSPGQGWDF